MYRRHYIEQDGNIILYLPDSLRFFCINEETKNIIEAVCEKEKKDVLSEYSIVDEESYESLKDLLEEKEPLNDTPKNKLIKLTLIISGNCNLSCKYCYANRGHFENNNGNMSISTLKDTLDRFFENYSEIENIMFFGGEPTLNMEAIRFGCEYIHSLYKQGKVNKLPNLGMVTNGTLVNDDLIDIIKNYNLNITVSLDGPKEVNDTLRVYENGSGTSSLIEKNIYRLKEECNQPVAIEATYTGIHEKMGFSVLDVIKYIQDKFNVEKVHIAPVSAIKESELAVSSRSPFIKSINEVYKWKKQGCDYRYTSYNLTLEGLKHKVVRTHYCEAGLSRFAVSAGGDVYPCYLFTDEEEVRMGNVKDVDLFTSEKMTLLQNKLRTFNKYKKEGCASCFNNTLCRQCIAENYYVNRNLHNVLEETCEFSKQRTEMIIGNLVKEQISEQS